MDSIATTISTWVTSVESQQTIFIILVAGAFFVMALGLSYFFVGTSNPVRRRLIDTAGMDEDFEPENKRVDIPTLIGPATQWLIPTSDIERNKTTKQLTYAGYRSPTALQTFYAIKAALFVTLPIITWFVMRWFPGLSSDQITWLMILAATAGLFGPNYALNHLEQARLKRLRDGFPDALDMLVVCVESGLGLSSAIQRVADEIGVSHEELAMEMSIVNAETRAGVDRTKALRNFADRTGLDDIRGLVSMLIQAMRFGTSVADTLRVYSEEFRDKRMQKAEEEAAKIGTKLIFPLVLCLFPSFFTVAIGPAVIMMVKAFGNM
jgi:tight adherence protein C